jgi:hypothetical protein
MSGEFISWAFAGVAWMIDGVALRERQFWQGHLKLPLQQRPRSITARLRSKILTIKFTLDYLESLIPNDRT